MISKRKYAVVLILIALALIRTSPYYTNYGVVQPAAEK